MERFTIHSLKGGEKLQHINNVYEGSDWNRYLPYFTPVDSQVVFYVYDNEKKQIIGFCACLTCEDKDYDDIGIKPDELYVRYLKVFNERTIGVDYRNHGFGTKLLQEVEKYARKEGFQRLLLDSMNMDTNMFYWKRGWVTKGFADEMIKELDSDIWLYACLFDECMNNALKTKDKDIYKEMIKLIKEKNYDNIFEYIAEEDGVKGYNPTMQFMAFDHLVQRKILNNKYVPHIIKELQDIISKPEPYLELRQYYEGNKLLKGSNLKELNRNSYVRNVMADIYLIERDKLNSKNRRETEDSINRSRSIGKDTL